jgi:uncharacterized protein (DUF4415 family)
MRRSGEDKTDWDRVRKMKEKDIVDDGEFPEITEEMLRTVVVTVRKPRKNLTMRVDPDLLDWFRAQGRGYQKKIHALMTAYRNAHVGKVHRKAS